MTISKINTNKIIVFCKGKNARKPNRVPYRAMTLHSERNVLIVGGRPKRHETFNHAEMVAFQRTDWWIRYNDHYNEINNCLSALRVYVSSLNAFCIDFS